MKASKRFIFAALLIFLSGACVFLPDKDIPYKPDERPDKVDEPDSTESPAVKDTLPTYRCRIYLEILSRLGFEPELRHTDIFIYGSELVFYERFEGSICDFVLHEAGEYIVMAVANAPGVFSPSALMHPDSWRGLEMELRYEKPRQAIMRAVGRISVAESSECVLALEPLLCAVQIASIGQNYEGDTMVENPRFYIENCCTRAELFKDEGFYCLDPQCTELAYLPYDIGLYTQYPGTTIYCYPNDMPPGVSSPASAIRMFYEVLGQTREIRMEVHPLKRNSIYLADIEIWP